MSFRRVGSGLPGMVADWVGDPDLERRLVRGAWQQVAGQAIARQTRVMELVDGTLRVRVLDAAWARSLRDLRGPLLAGLREALGARAPRDIEWV